MTIYRSKGSNEKQNNKEQSRRNTSFEPMSEADKMLNTMAKKWLTQKATSIEPEELLNKMLQSAGGNKIIEQGKTFVKEMFQKTGINNTIETDSTNSEDEDSINISSNDMNWGKIIEALEDKSNTGNIEDSHQAKEDAMNIISQVLDRTKQILDKNDKDA